MSPELVEISRKLANMVRLGSIAEVNHAAQRCRVQSGGLLTDWLPWATPRAGDTRDWDPPTIGEQVLILSPSGEVAAAVVMTGIYSTAHPAPSASPSMHRRVYPDGAVIEYDHASHALLATGISTATIQASTSVTLDTPYTHVTGTLEVDGLLTYHDGIAGNAGTHGNGNHIVGDIQVISGDVTADSISLKSHVHGGIQPGGGNTGVPE